MGCAVIGTNQGGIKEVINNKNGIIVKEDEKSLYNAMKKMIDKPELRKTLSKNLREDIKNKFSWEVTAKRILKDMEVN